MLSKMATGFVNHATGVGDHFPGAQGAVRKSIFFFVNGNLACGLSLLDRPGLGVSNGAGFFLRNFGLALCSGRILVLCAGVLSYVQGSKSYVQGSKSYVQGSKSYVQGSKSYVQVAKFSSSVFL